MNGVGIRADGNMDWRAVNRPARCPDDGTASALRGWDSPSGGVSDLPGRPVTCRTRRRAGACVVRQRMRWRPTMFRA